MKERMDDSGVLNWRDVLEKHCSALVDEVSLRLDSELQNAVAAAVAKERTQAVAETRRATAESLNQTLRLLRDAPAEIPVFRILTEATAQYAQRAVVLSFENNQSEITQARPISFRGADERDFIFDTASAAAIASAIESKDPVVALGSAAEISSDLAGALGGGADEKVYLYPIVARQNVIAMLVALGDVSPAPLELLCGAAGMKIECLEAPRAIAPLKSPGLVQIGTQAREGPIQGTAAAEHRTWDELSAEDQKVHLQAQRVARVKVAEMRLYQADALRKGVFAGDIYDALRAEIDTARTEFLQSFLAKSSTMVDYLHLEILRSLAHDDDRLLGKDYPGPMV